MKIASIVFAGVLLAMSGFTVFAQSPSISPSPEEATQGATQDDTAGEETFTVTLAEQNGSGVSGQATITQSSDGSITVSLNADGLEENQVHPQHIHGLSSGEGSQCPTDDLDENGDGIVSLEEGQSVTGPAMLSLEPFPTAEGGSIDFEETYTQDLTPLDGKVIELHGMTVDGEYLQSVPVACGEITSGGQGGAGLDDSTGGIGSSTQNDDTTVPNGAPNTGFKGL